MDSMVEICMDRAHNELIAAESLKQLSEDKNKKADFDIPSAMTFYSAVISHSYYAIFYAARVILLLKSIKVSSPEIHRKTFDAFQKTLVETGILDVKLLEIYKTIVIRADGLLEIFKEEKWKRGNFTYATIPQANKVPAEDSLKNSKLFVLNIGKVIARM